MKLLLSGVLIFIISANVTAQYSDSEIDKLIASSTTEELVIQSSQLLEEGYYTAAERLVDKLLEKDPENCNYNYRKGVILADARGDYAGSVKHLEKAAKDIDKNYDMYSGSEKSAGLDALYHLGRGYHRLGDLTKARDYYTSFLAQAKKETQLTKSAQLGLKQLDLAQQLYDNPRKNVNIVNLGDVINSPQPEYSPLVSFDGSALYYTSRREWPEGQTPELRDPQFGLYPEDVYVSYKDFDETWTTPIRLDFCKPDQNEASISVSVDERRIYVYQDIVGGGDIFYSDFSTNRFKDIKALENKDVNTKFWDTHCFVTPDGRTMYFASERPDGYGGRDIYRIVKMADNTWSQPMNLGPIINSAYDEDAPFMASDNKSLFFASNGPRSMGGFDILLSVIDADNNWSDPINLGVPMNSTQDDLFYTETIDGRRGYITSMRSDTKGEKDIYEIQNDYMTINRGAILKGKVIVLNGRPMPEDVTITVACSDCNDQYARTVYPRMRDGAFSMTLDPCRTYEIIFRYQNGEKEIYRETFNTDCKKEKDEIYREVYLDADKMAIVPKDTTPITQKDTIIPVIHQPEIVLKNYEPLSFRHTFGYNKNKLAVTEARMKSFLKSVEAQLKDGREKIVIEITSSASFVPTHEFKDNQELSESRAANMKAMLEKYFEQSVYKNKVQIVVVSSVVSGPEYESDSRNTKKYIPFQFVELKTN